MQLGNLTEKDFYKNLDWIADNQVRIEKALYKKRYGNEPCKLFLYDVTSSYFEGIKNGIRSRFEYCPFLPMEKLLSFAHGCEGHESFWTVLATCKKGLNVMDFLRQSIQHFILGGREPPSFLKAMAEQHFFAAED